MTENPQFITWLYYLLPVALVTSYGFYSTRRQARNHKILETNRREGMAEPASLHPVFDEVKCLGCRACIKACPEGDVIGLINNKAQLINPSHCIGHGACKKACPFDAISLVFGTAKRGVDIPFVSETFETNIPGIFIAGELGGMGLIRNAIEQGKQAMKSIIARTKPDKANDIHDVIIVGAGPAGIAATLSAHEKKLNYLTLEQDSLGGTVFNFPRGKIVMTAPVDLPMVGKIKIRETTKEALLELWQDVENRTGIHIRYNEGVASIKTDNENFVVTSNKGSYRTRNVLLSIGRRGTPRKLDVPGEELPKVVYRLIDPEQYRNQKVLVVGGGDSALEAALSIADESGTEVTLSYRSGAFSRAKEKNRSGIQSAMDSGRINVLFNSNVKTIDEHSVTIVQEDRELKLDNHAIIVSAGGILPSGFLKEIGIEVETKYGTA
ncbi:MAG: 4Fe-4S dicluster domain-containing protein [Gammaproteobacteria bacterium]|nr:MAG: 4Fe-4S dicluster domain-containing protein [Gammaproteobacteria bacterium]